MADLELFKRHVPDELTKLLDRINQVGFTAYLIGGIPRDYLLSSQIGDDFDFELRPIEEEGMNERYQELINSLRKDGLKLREMGLGIHEINFKNFSVEFGLPRLEEFTDEVHHSNFKAVHIPDLDLSQGFKRRDFTINAVAFKYDGDWEVCDPLDGISDIQKKLLRACDPQSFVKDPVRFLRAIRFAVKLDFLIDPALLTLLEHMKLKISPHYLKLEATKSQRALRFFMEACRLRSEVFKYPELIKEENSVREYSQEFSGEGAKKHIEEAFFLSSKTRKTLLNDMGMSSKGVLEFPIKEMNLSSAANKSAKELQNSSWAKGAMKFFSLASAIGKKKVNWLMQEAGSPYDYSFIEEYHSLTLKLPKDVPSELLSIEVFKRKLQKLIN